MDATLKQKLLDSAVEMLQSSYCPYSEYHVGAAILTEDDSIYTGCNIENASYPATICAERTAAVKAVSEGHQRFKAIAIAVSGEVPGYPCGVCRQFLNEFVTEDMPVYMIDSTGTVTEDTFYHLFPHGFKGEDMEL